MDFSKCFMEVDILAMSMSGKEQQLGAKNLIYQSGTDPYQEGGLLPLLGGLARLISKLVTHPSRLP